MEENKNVLEIVVFSMLADVDMDNGAEQECRSH